MDKDSYVQSVIFAKDSWSLKEAKKWLKDKGYTKDFKGKGVDETGQSYRFRQAKPLSKKKKHEGYHYTTMHPKEGVSFVMINKPDGKMKKYEEAHHKEKEMRFPKTEDEAIAIRTEGMFNMPMEYRSNLPPLIGHPYKDNPYVLAMHHPTEESYKEYMGVMLY